MSKLVESLSEAQTGQFIVMTVNGDMHNHYGPYQDEAEANEAAAQLQGQVYPLLEPEVFAGPDEMEDWAKTMPTPEDFDQAWKSRGP